MINFKEIAIDIVDNEVYFYCLNSDNSIDFSEISVVPVLRKGINTGIIYFLEENEVIDLEATTEISPADADFNKNTLAIDVSDGQIYKVFTMNW